jgi:uncharacterized membrane protein YfcA
MLFIGGVAGILAGYLGIGGGILLVPILQEYLSLKSIELDNAIVIAAATSLTITCVAAGTVAWERWRKNEMILSAIPPVLLGALIGSYAGAWTATHIPGKSVRLIFGIFLTIASIQLAFQTTPHLNTDNNLRVPFLPLALLGILTGILSALLGIGGGVLMIPVFILLFHFPWDRASGTSSAIASFTSLIGVIGYILTSGDRLQVNGLAWSVVDWKAAIPLAIASLATARIGTRLSRRFGGVVYKRVFAGLLLVLAIRMLTSSL